MSSSTKYGITFTRALLLSSATYFSLVGQFDFGASLWGIALVKHSAALAERFGYSWSAAHWIFAASIHAAYACALYLLYNSPRISRYLPQPLVVAGLVIFGGMPVTLGAAWMEARLLPALTRGREPVPADWPEAFRVAQAHLFAPEFPTSSPLERAGEMWLWNKRTHRPSLLRLSGHTLVELPLPPESEPLWKNHCQPVSGGEVAFDTATMWDLPTRERLFMVPWNYHCETWSPLPFRMAMTAEGSASAWSGRVIDSNTAPVGKVLVTGPAGEPTTSIDLSPLGSGYWSVTDVDPSSRSVTLVRSAGWQEKTIAPDLTRRGYGHEFCVTSFDGSLRWRLPRPGYEGHLRTIPHGWAWWQSREERRQWPVDWNLRGRAGSHRAASGRCIVGVSVHPLGSLIALSVGDVHRTGKVPDAVYVLRAIDGREVFRRNLPPFANSHVQFLGESHLAYSDFDGHDGFVRVVEIPPQLRN